MTREQRAREALALTGYGASTILTDTAIDAILNFANQELERAYQIADTGMTRCLQKVDGRGLNDARWIRDSIRAMMQEN